MRIVTASKDSTRWRQDSLIIRIHTAGQAAIAFVAQLPIDKQRSVAIARDAQSVLMPRVVTKTGCIETLHLPYSAREAAERRADDRLKAARRAGL